MIELGLRVLARARHELRRVDLVLWRLELDLCARELEQRLRARRRSSDGVVITYSGPEIHA